MKLKTIVGSMALLGLVSTAAMAAPMPAAGVHNAPGSNQAFWNSVMQRNQDNNGTFASLANGQSKLTGEAAVSVNHNDRRDGFVASGGEKKSSDRFSLDTAELYLDSQINDWASAHVAYDFDANQQFFDSANTSHAAYLSEAYVTLTGGALDKAFVKVGQQTLNVGSTDHDSLMAPMTQAFTETNTNAVSFGVGDLDGFYVDASVFNGANYGKTAPERANSAAKINGYTAEIGYAMNQGTNKFYGGYNGFNVYSDYLSNIDDASQITFDTYDFSLAEQIPVYTLDAVYVKGPFQIIADYVTVAKAFADNELTWNGKGAKPNAYNLEADFSWDQGMTQTVSLAYSGTEQLSHGLTRSAGPYYGAESNIPQSQIVLGYNISLSKNVEVQTAYVSQKDYAVGAGDSTQSTGDTMSTLVGRLKVAF